MTLRKLFPFLGALLCVAGPLCAQTSPLEVSLRTTAKTVRIDQPVTLFAVVRNADKASSVALPGTPAFGANGGLTLVVTDANGAARVIAPRSGLGAGNSANDGERAAVLRQGEALAVRHSERGRNLFPTAGTYHLRVRYTFAPNGGRGASSSIDSAPVTVRVLL